MINPQYVLLALFTSSVGAGVVLQSCGKGSEPTVYVPQVADGYCGDTQVGEVRTTACEAGQAGFVFESCTYEGWKVQANTCGADPAQETTPRNLDLNYVGTTILNDLSALEGGEQLDTRYLLTANKYNEQVAGIAQDMTVAGQGVDKGLNSISRSRFLEQSRPVDARKTIWAFNLADLGLTAIDWENWITLEALEFVDNTQVGLLAQRIAGSRQPWLFADSGLTTAFGVAPLYYSFTQTPRTLIEFEAKIGTRLARNIARFDPEVCFTGHDDSVIALEKTRLAIRMGRSNDGWAWITQDTDLGVQNARTNLFLNPLFLTGLRRFVPAASEILYSLPNGMMAGALFAADGTRQNAAPITTVRDVRAPYGNGEIKNMISCMGCHYNGLLPLKDEIRNAVAAAAGQFTADDVARVNALYKGCDSLIAKDNAFYQSKLAELGTPSVGAKGQVTSLMDSFQVNLNLERAASLTLLPPAEFLALLRGSQAGSAALSPLLGGGSVPLRDFLAVFPQLKIDFRLGQDPINRVRR